MQIRHPAYLFILIAITLWAPCSALGQTGHQTGKQDQPDVTSSQRDAQLTRVTPARQKQEYLKRISLLEASITAEQAKLREDKRRFEALWHEEQKLRTQSQPGEDETQKVWEVYLAARSDLRAMLESSLLHEQVPIASGIADNPEGHAETPGFEDVKQLVEVLFEEMAASGKVMRRQGTFIGSEGTEVAGEILLVGDFNAFYRTPGEVGFLWRDKTSGRLTGTPAAASWFDTNDQRIADYFDGSTAVLPLDLSGGESFTHFSSGQDLLDRLRSGGVLVWPILLVGLVALVLILERLMFLLRTQTDTAELMAGIQQLAAKGRWQECQQHCSRYSKTPVSRVLQAGLSHLGNSREILESALQEAILKELPPLERFLSTISVLAAVAPLLGLLGTVSGMINTFHAITIYGTGDPRMLSGGISEALITTQLGLTVAVPLLILHHFLERRMDNLIGEMEEKSTALSVVILKHRRIHDGMADQAA